MHLKVEDEIRKYCQRVDQGFVGFRSPPTRSDPGQGVPKYGMVHESIDNSAFSPGMTEIPSEQSNDRNAPTAPADTTPSAASSRGGLRQQNRKLGLMLASWAVSAFAIAILVAVLVHYVEIHHVLTAH